MKARAALDCHPRSLLRALPYQPEKKFCGRRKRSHLGSSGFHLTLVDIIFFREYRGFLLYISPIQKPSFSLKLKLKTQTLRARACVCSFSIL